MKKKWRRKNKNVVIPINAAWGATSKFFVPLSFWLCFCHWRSREEKKKFSDRKNVRCLHLILFAMNPKHNFFPTSVFPSSKCTAWEKAIQQQNFSNIQHHLRKRYDIQSSKTLFDHLIKWDTNSSTCTTRYNMDFVEVKENSIEQRLRLSLPVATNSLENVFIFSFGRKLSTIWFQTLIFLVFVAVFFLSSSTNHANQFYVSDDEWWCCTWKNMWNILLNSVCWHVLWLREKKNEEKIFFSFAQLSSWLSFIQ